MPTYYNEIDPYAVAWLRNLIAAGHLPAGDVDERSIVDVQPDDLRGYGACHFFAGIGGWAYALRLAGVPDDRPIWTGSCPCQPFSAAGKAGGFDDERHLWPAFYHLIGQQHPPIVFGEQVASKDGLAWLDLVQSDMEGAGYAFGAVDICAAGIGAPHIRQRLYFMANSGSKRRQQECRSAPSDEEADGWEQNGNHITASLGAIGSLDNSADARRDNAGEYGSGPSLQSARLVESSDAGWMANANGDGYTTPKSGSGGATALVQGIDRAAVTSAEQLRRTGDATSRTNGFWRDADWIYCRDEKWRAVESGTFPLAHGIPARVGKLRAYGNAIVAPLAAEFIHSALGAR